MKKVQVGFKFRPEVDERLKDLAEVWGLTRTAWLEGQIMSFDVEDERRAAAEERGIDAAERSARSAERAAERAARKASAAADLAGDGISVTLEDGPVVWEPSEGADHDVGGNVVINPKIGPKKPVRPAERVLPVDRPDGSAMLLGKTKWRKK